MSFVEAHRDRFGVEPILRVLEIPVSTFYGWVAQQRDPSKRRRDDQALTDRIRRIHDRSGQPVLLAFHHYDETGQFMGELSDPMPVGWENGELKVPKAAEA